MTDAQSTGEQIGAEIGKQVGGEIGKEVGQHLTGKHRDRTKKTGKSPIARRVGYAFGIFFALLFLWIISNFENWGWRFITDEWSQVAGIVRLSITIDLFVYLILMILDPRILYYLAKLLSNVVGIYVGIRMFQVFPFDFAYLFGGWTWLNTLFPILIILGILGTGIAIVVRTAKLAQGKEIYE